MEVRLKTDLCATFETRLGLFVSPEKSAKIVRSAPLFPTCTLPARDVLIGRFTVVFSNF